MQHPIKENKAPSTPELKNMKEEKPLPSDRREPIHFISDFIRSLFNIEEVKSFKRMFFTMMSAPVSGTIQFYENHDYIKAFRFLSYVAILWVIVVVSKGIIASHNSFSSSLVTNLAFFVSIMTALFVMFKVSSNESEKQRTIKEFVAISSFNIGICTALMVLTTYISLISPFIGLLIMLGILIKYSRQTIKVLEYFWQLSTAKIITNFAISAYAGLLAGFIFLGVCASLFGVKALY